MVAVVSIPTVHLLRIRPRTKPVEIAWVNRSISASRYAFAIRVARKAARTSPPQVAMASSTSASTRAAVPASDFFERCEAFTPGYSEENKMRTFKWGSRRKVKLAASAIDAGQPRHGSKFPEVPLADSQRFLRATEPLKLRKGHCSREARTQPFGQYTEIRIDVISRPAILTWRNSHGRTWQSPSRML